MAALSLTAHFLTGAVLTGAAPADQPTIDIYEDPLCLACGHLEQQIGTQLRAALAGNQVAGFLVALWFALPGYRRLMDHRDGG